MAVAHSGYTAMSDGQSDGCLDGRERHDCPAKLVCLEPPGVLQQVAYHKFLEPMYAHACIGIV